MSLALRLQAIQRLLILAQRYITTVEVKGYNLQFSNLERHFLSLTLDICLLFESRLVIYCVDVHVCFKCTSPHNSVVTVVVCTSYAFVSINLTFPPQESHHYPRAVPPHGATFLGHPLVLSISYETLLIPLEVHSNESMLSIKEKIAHKLNTTVEQLQLATQDRWLDTSDNNKLVHQMGFTDNQVLTTKVQSNLSNTYSRVAEVCMCHCI